MSKAKAAVTAAGLALGYEILVRDRELSEREKLRRQRREKWAARRGDCDDEDEEVEEVPNVLELLGGRGDDRDDQGSESSSVPPLEAVRPGLSQHVVARHRECWQSQSVCGFDDCPVDPHRQRGLG